MKVFKYEIPMNEMFRFEIQMPAKSKILTVQAQYNTACIWALVNTEYKGEIRKFRVYGTGHRLINTEKYNYIGTFQMLGGNFVGHLFEIISGGDD